MGHGLAVSDPAVWFWWVGGGVLLIIELMSGTFYLLMIALGFLLAGVSRLFGASGGVQVLVAAVLALVAVAGVRIGKRIWRRRQRARAAVSEGDVPLPFVGGDRTGQTDPSANMDIGASVWVEQWLDGRARVTYRGSQWDAMLGSTGANLAAGVAETGVERAEGSADAKAILASAPGWYHIHRIDGIRLILLP